MKFPGSTKKKSRKKKAEPQINGHSYDERDSNLRKMQFKCYRDYLNSNLWGRIRNKVFQRKGYRCSLCSGHAEELHHNRYSLEDLQGKDISHIHPVCSLCHYMVEHTASGTKRDLIGAKDEFNHRRKLRVGKIKFDARRDVVRRMC